VNGAPVLLAGVTYKKDSADTRVTPAVPVTRKLLRGGAGLSYADPYVRERQVDGHPIGITGLSADAVEAADLVILLRAHSAFDLDALASHAQAVLDTRASPTAGIASDSYHGLLLAPGGLGSAAPHGAQPRTPSPK
jgi:UDP-N-acetyl-D-glucosamine dehydrogenase